MKQRKRIIIDVAADVPLAVAAGRVLDALADDRVSEDRHGKALWSVMVYTSAGGEKVSMFSRRNRPSGAYSESHTFRVSKRPAP